MQQIKCNNLIPILPKRHNQSDRFNRLHSTFDWTNTNIDWILKYQQFKSERDNS